ncbi:MAG: TetR/AcrR family transcriptional regulator [Acidimicrobiales bacterium]
MSSSPTARDRVRAEITREILIVARKHLADEGAAALSLRAIARDMEMAPSAIYRYFPGRDALLSALILEAYGSLADSATRASTDAYGGDGTEAERWLAVPRLMREWALAHPHEWGLVFGSPVPGYQAPEETVAPYARLAMALVRPVLEAHGAGELHAVEDALVDPTALDAALSPVREAIMPGVPVSTVSACVRAWATLIGVINLELFGHWHNTVLDPALLFEETLRQQVVSIGLRSCEPQRSPPEAAPMRFRAAVDPGRS